MNSLFGNRTHYTVTFESLRKTNNKGQRSLSEMYVTKTYFRIFEMGTSLKRYPLLHTVPLHVTKFKDTPKKAFRNIFQNRFSMILRIIGIFCYMRF